jgi:hypothetical protein
MRIITNEFTSHQNKSGEYSSLIDFFLLLIYVLETTIGLLLLETPSEPNSDPYFTQKELLIITIARRY